MPVSGGVCSCVCGSGICVSVSVSVHVSFCSCVYLWLVCGHGLVCPWLCVCGIDSVWSCGCVFHMCVCVSIAFCVCVYSQSVGCLCGNNSVGSCVYGCVLCVYCDVHTYVHRSVCGRVLCVCGWLCLLAACQKGNVSVGSKIPSFLVVFPGLCYLL